MWTAAALCGQPEYHKVVRSRDAEHHIGLQEMQLRKMCNHAIASTLKFLNVIYLTTCNYSTAVFECIGLADGSSVLQAYPGIPRYPSN